MKLHEGQTDCRWSVNAQIDKENLRLSFCLCLDVNVLNDVDSPRNIYAKQAENLRGAHRERMAHTYFDVFKSDFATA